MLAGISLGERIVGWVANAEFIVSNSDRLHWADDVFFHPLFGLGALLVGFGGLMVFGRTQGIEATKKTPIPQEGSPTHMAALLPDKIWVPNPKSREGVVERLSQFKGLECEIVWATGGKFFRYSGAEPVGSVP